MHLNPHAKCRSARFNLKLFKQEKRGSLKLWKHITFLSNLILLTFGIQVINYVFTSNVESSVDRDQMTSSEINWVKGKPGRADHGLIT